MGHGSRALERWWRGDVARLVCRRLRLLVYTAPIPPCCTVRHSAPSCSILYPSSPSPARPARTPIGCPCRCLRCLRREMGASTRPSLAAGASGSHSKFSGDHSGVGAAAAGGGASQWGASSRTATSKGLGNQHQLRMRALSLGYVGGCCGLRLAAGGAAASVSVTWLVNSSGCWLWSWLVCQ
jgi:hypothetical protein